MAGHTFKAGDRVEVIAPPDGSEWPDGSFEGRYFRVGSIGTVIEPDAAIVRFDEQEGVNSACNREWHVAPWCLRLLAPNDNAQKVGVLAVLNRAMGRLFVLEGALDEGLNEASATVEAMAEALKGVIRVADRATAEFDAARAALARYEGTPNAD